MPRLPAGSRGRSDRGAETTGDRISRDTLADLNRCPTRAGNRPNTLSRRSWLTRRPYLAKSSRSVPRIPSLTRSASKNECGRAKVSTASGIPPSARKARNCCRSLRCAVSGMASRHRKARRKPDHLDFVEEDQRLSGYEPPVILEFQQLQHSGRGFVDDPPQEVPIPISIDRAADRELTFREIFDQVRFANLACTSYHKRFPFLAVLPFHEIGKCSPIHNAPFKGLFRCQCGQYNGFLQDSLGLDLMRIGKVSPLLIPLNFIFTSP